MVCPHERKERFVLGCGSGDGIHDPADFEIRMGADDVDVEVWTARCRWAVQFNSEPAVRNGELVGDLVGDTEELPSVAHRNFVL